MPAYDYECEKCGKKETLIQRMSEKKSPLCCEQEMNTLIGATAFVLKGGCWAKDGYTKK